MPMIPVEHKKILNMYFRYNGKIFLSLWIIETALLNKDLLEVLPGVEEANAISEELDKKCKFEIMLLSPQWLGKTSGRTEVRKL